MLHTCPSACARPYVRRRRAMGVSVRGKLSEVTISLSGATALRWALGSVLLASAPSASSAQTSFCDGTESAASPSRDLYCIELVPAVGIRAGTGRVELGRTPGPFTVDASADGHLRYTPAITLAGLA